MRLLPLLCCLLASLAFAEDVPVRVSPLGGPLYLLQGQGGNVLVSAGADGVLLIDDDYAQMAPAYEKALADIGYSDVRFVVNTHWHGDHTGGNAFWGETGAVIVAHDNVLARMSTPQESAFFERTTPASPREALPLVSYGTAMALHINDDVLEIAHYPNGHTDGDSVIFFRRADVVHTGDHFFKDRFPFIDLESGGNVDSFIRNVAALVQLVGEETVIVPGHGPLAERSDLQAFHTMLINTRAEVQAMIDDGLTLQDMQARGLDSRWDSWGAGFIKPASWIAILAAGR